MKIVIIESLDIYLGILISYVSQRHYKTFNTHSLPSPKPQSRTGEVDFPGTSVAI